MPLSPSGSGHANDLGRSEGREAVHERDAYLDFCSLAVGVSGGDAFAEGLEAPHLRLDPTSDVVSRPSLPECPAVVPGGAEGFVSGDCGRAILFPRPPVLAGRDDWSGLPVDDGRVATAGVIGPISGHGADLFVVGYLVEQLRQNGCQRRSKTGPRGGAKLCHFGFARGMCGGQSAALSM
jgi:hypothetical protein